MQDMAIVNNGKQIGTRMRSTDGAIFNYLEWLSEASCGLSATAEHLWYIGHAHEKTTQRDWWHHSWRLQNNLLLWANWFVYGQSHCSSTARAQPGHTVLHTQHVPWLPPPLAPPQSRALSWNSATPTYSNYSLQMSRNKQTNNIYLLIKP